MFVFTENLVGFTIVWFCIDQAWHQTLLLPSSSEKKWTQKTWFHVYRTEFRNPSW